MARIVLLDSGPLGMVTHPRPNLEIVNWLQSIIKRRIKVLVPEIADYEVRRELLRSEQFKSVSRLNDLKRNVGFLPITSKSMLKAAAFWAQARQEGYPTADDHSLDADVILAAQAVVLAKGKHDVVIATANVGHLSRFVQAEPWEAIK
jgi:predicted nucleic acid-binding protein